MKEKKIKERKTGKPGKSKKRLIIVFVILAVLIILAVVLGLFLSKRIKKGQNGNFPFGSRQNGSMQFAMTENMLAASGVTGAGVTEERFEVEELSTGLEIEEVYVSSDQSISEGAKVLKISEESITEAREELQQALKDADLAYRSGVIEYEKSKITAEYDRDSTLLDGEHAKAVYDENISNLTTSVERARDELQQARDDIAEYQSYVNNDSYRSYFKVDEYQAAYDTTLAALESKMAEWGVSWSQVTGQGGGISMGGNMSQGGGTGMGSNMSQGSGNGMGAMPMTVSAGDSIQNQGPTSDQIKALAALYDVLEVQRKNLDQAESDYQNALSNAAFELQTLQLQLPELENALMEAEKNYKNQLLQAELTYEKTLANAKSAEEDYETNMEQAETTYESLKKDWEDAKENLELFESSVGDGYFYASGSGTILRTMVRSGQYLSADSTVFMYRNPEEMTVSVSIDQTDISKVKLNDSVYIQSTKFGSFEGMVKEINVISDSESRTNVTYTVTVQFSGADSGIGANETVTVIFGVDAETLQNMLNSNAMTGTGDGEMPEGFNPGEMPEGFEPGQMPEGFDPGQMPQGGGRNPFGGFGNGNGKQQ